MSGDTPVAVLVRVRPLPADAEPGELRVDGPHVVARGRRGQDQAFAFQQVFDDREGPQDDALFAAAADGMAEGALNGINACVLAYGQTGSGKTHTMFGRGGVIRRAGAALFARIEELGLRVDEENVTVTASYLEIYNEKVHDLLSPDPGRRRSLAVTGAGEVADLTEVLLRDADGFGELLDYGAQWRTVAATALNQSSSRSHAVITLGVVRKKTNADAATTEARARVFFADLAGSERVKASGAEGERFGEACKINRSLTALGVVIDRLARRDGGHVPYRDSVLTRLLQDALGGNSRTCMVATVSAAAADAEQTLGTLRYASIASTIVNSVAVNEAPWARRVRSLQRRVAELESSLRVDAALRAELEALRAQVAASTSTSTSTAVSSPPRRASVVMRAGRLALEKMGVSGAADGLALVNVAADAALTGTLRFPLREGVTVVSSHHASSDSDSASDASDASGDEDDAHRIVLPGAAICTDHCRFRVSRGRVTLEARRGADTFVNGALQVGRCAVAPGARIVLGIGQAFALLKGAAEPALQHRDLVREVMLANRGHFGLPPSPRAAPDPAPPTVDAGPDPGPDPEPAVELREQLQVANDICRRLALPFEFRRAPPASLPPPMPQQLPPTVAGSPGPPMGLLTSEDGDDPRQQTTINVTAGDVGALWDAAEFQDAFFTLQELDDGAAMPAARLRALAPVSLAPVAALLQARSQVPATDCRGQRVAMVEATVSWQLAGGGSGGAAASLDELRGREISLRVRASTALPDAALRLRMRGVAFAGLGAVDAELRVPVTDELAAYLRGAPTVAVELWSAEAAEPARVDLAAAPADVQGREACAWLLTRVWAAAARQAILGSGLPPTPGAAGTPPAVASLRERNEALAGRVRELESSLAAAAAAVPPVPPSPEVVVVRRSVVCSVS